MAVRPIDAMELKQRMCALCNQYYSDEPCEPSDCVFVRAINEAPPLTPPNEPLTLEQLRKMDGQPVWCEWLLPEDRAVEDGKWFIVIVGEKTGLEIKRPTDYGDYFLKIEDYGKTWLAYAYSPARIDREAWTAEWKDHYKSGVHAGTGAICSSCDVWNERKTHICPFCGKAMDEDGFAMLEKRMGVR